MRSYLRKHSVLFQLRQIDPEHSPLMHSCVPLLHFVLSSRGFGSGHSLVVPLQIELHEHSDSSRQRARSLEGTNAQLLGSQHGPWLGLHCVRARRLQPLADEFKAKSYSLTILG